MSSQMRRIQQAFRDTEDVRLVSFTVDPKTDTPKVLQAYARRYTADAGVWTFLTGELEQLHDLSRNVFKLADVSGDLNHSTRFVLVDRRSRIRGYYATWEEGTIDKLIADIQFLLQEPA
jgi:protein SCO1/2